MKEWMNISSDRIRRQHLPISAIRLHTSIPKEQPQEQEGKQTEVTENERAWILCILFCRRDTRKGIPPEPSNTVTGASRFCTAPP